MEDYETGDVILFKPNEGALISNLITRMTDSKYSHAVIVYGDLNGTTMVLNADYNDAHLVPLSFFDRDYDLFQIQPGEDLSKNELQKTMISYIGTEYDLGQLVFGYLPRIMFGIDKVLNNPNKVVCIELVDKIYFDLGVDVIERYRTGNITPQDYAESDDVVLKYSSYK